MTDQVQTPPKKSNLPTPEKYAIPGSEASEQIALFMWAAQPIVLESYPELKWMFHIPNGGFRYKGEAGKLRAMGVKAGVSDICLPIKRHEFAGLWIELKAHPKKDRKKPHRKASTEQDIWIEFFRGQGFGAMICVGWEHARDTIVSYLEYKGNGQIK